MVHPVYADMPATIFEEMSSLARRHDAINLGQGFPDAPGPPALLRAAADAVLRGSNQYPPSTGLPQLREAVAAHYGRTQALDLTPEQVIVTSGATEAIAAALLALLSPGDEAVMFQPLYDAYLPLVHRAGGAARLATLAPPYWRLTREVLDQAFSPKTRLVILNNPMNPSARLFDDEELALLASYCVAHDAIALCDEVWEAVVPAPGRFKPLMAFPGMAQRTVKVGSAGKLFGLTGWKVGWMIADPPLAQVLARAHQFLTFTTPPNLQAAVAHGLESMPDWFTDMPAGMGRSRDRLAAGLTSAGYAVLPSQATYFLTVDLSASGVDLDDRSFALRAVAEHGVEAIPVSALYARDPATNILRLCFAKADDTLDEAVERLAAARRALG
jgi:aspartate/methionine/tyrosine aminotransferase